MAFDPAKFLARFVDESREHCSRLTDGLLSLEHAPGDTEALNALFRSAHTIKGSSRMLKQTAISGLAHCMEDVLDALRNVRISFSPMLSDVLFRGVDTLTAMLDELDSGKTPHEAPRELCGELAAVARGEAASPAPEPAVATGDETRAGSGILPPLQGEGRGGDGVGCGVSVNCQDNPHPPPDLPLERGGVKGSKPALPPESSPDPVIADTRGAKPGSRKRDYLRVNAAKLDDLIRLMGEIVSEHSRSRQHVRRLRELDHAMLRYTDSLSDLFDRYAVNDKDRAGLLRAGKALHHSLHRTVRVVSDAGLTRDHQMGDLQETSLKLRMLPLSTVFDSLRRTVRDLARGHGKDVDFRVDGGETELDRKIIERIGDPLIHMIRNALDHGLESPEERLAAGKPPRGSISLAAFYDGGCVTIMLRDDGRGLSVEKIRRKALAKGLYDADTLAGMSRSEVTNIIFLPGFSTSPIITDLSGRGVGMDVVRKNIVDDLKGAIIIDTKEGEGTTFCLRLPLNLAVSPLLLVSTGGKTCALPATSIAEMLSMQWNDIITIINKRAIRLREQLIPVEDLAAVLGLPHSDGNGDDAMVIIVRDGDERLGLLVDRILGREEMVVKPLPLHMQRLRMVSGATIGEEDGIINVLHVPELFRQSRSLPGTAQQSSADAGERAATVLVVDDSFNTREIEKNILEAYGYQVATAGDGEEAFEKTRTELYDLVITDVEMPRLDGFSLTERLRGDERYRTIPIIIVTSREKEADRKRGIMVGADAYIVKGAFDQSVLLETVRSLIG
jgi:two-component system, chemotaxis family, sensor kinase CheA